MDSNKATVGTFYLTLFLAFLTVILVALGVLTIGSVYWFWRYPNAAQAPAFGGGVLVSYWGPTIILASCLLLVVALQIVVARLIRGKRNQVAASSGQSESEEASIKAQAKVGELDRKLSNLQEKFDDTEWLRNIATEQARALQDCVEVDCQIASHKLTGDNPYLDFLISVRNHCVYAVSLSDQMNGSISFGNTRLTHAPVLASNRVKDLAINQLGYFELHQQLTSNEAARLLSEHGSFAFYGLTTKMSGSPGLAERDFDLRCSQSITQEFINANYPKLYIQIEPQDLHTYFGYYRNNEGLEIPRDPLGTIVNLKVRFKNWRPLKVRQFKLVTSGPVVVAEAGELREKPHRSPNGRATLSGEELYPNLANLDIDVDRDNEVEGWLQFIVKGIPPDRMLRPEDFVVRLHVVDESGEEHRQDVTGLKYEPRALP